MWNRCERYTSQAWKHANPQLKIRKQSWHKSLKSSHTYITLLKHDTQDM